MAERFARQVFLGAGSEETLQSLTVGIVGLGGGGSHVVQQLAHIGVGSFVLYDPQRIEDSNLNRLVGGTAADVASAEWKTVIACRLIAGINPSAHVLEVRDDWKNKADHLRNCDIIVGCVDTYQARSELEIQAQRYLTPYLDIGMDVHEQPGGDHLVAGQVILSLPARPCMRCMGFIRDELLGDEAGRYGAAGPRPQVVWPNGALASIAVGVLVQLFTPWHTDPLIPIYLEYDGNMQTVRLSNRLAHVGVTCGHFGAGDLGDPWFAGTESGPNPTP